MAKALRRLRIQNPHEKRPFVPYNRLVETLIRDTVIDLLKGELDISFTRRNEIADAVLNGGLRLFAILVDIDELAALVRFLELDKLSDSKLPLSEQDLTTILKEYGSDTADQFFSTQWTYLPPILVKNHSCRTLDPWTVLPFEEIEMVQLASPGGFSEVHIVQLHTPDNPLALKVRAFLEAARVY